MTVYYIERKRYNTETSIEIASDSWGNGPSDFNYVREILFVTPKGTWWIEYEGGANSRYRESVSQNTWSGSTGARSISRSEAYEWLEESDKLTEFMIAEYFDDLVKDA
jgi:hypothetical protein